MKKILSALVVSSALVGSAVAAPGDMYLGVNVGVNKLDKSGKVKDKDTKSYLAKFKTSPEFGINAGYYINENMRAALTLDYSQLNLKSTKTAHDAYVKTNKLKASSMALMANVYYDVVDLGAAKLFVGLGAGVTHNKIKGTNTETVKSTGKSKALDPSKDKKTTFAAAAHLGLSTELSDGINAELVYSYKHLGNFAKDKETGFKVKGQGHGLRAGVRFDM